MNILKTDRRLREPGCDVNISRKAHTHTFWLKKFFSEVHSTPNIKAHLSVTNPPKISPWRSCRSWMAGPYRGADNSLARPGKKQATATKLQLLQATQKKIRKLSVQQGLRDRNDLCVGKKMANFQFFFRRFGLRTYQHPCVLDSTQNIPNVTSDCYQRSSKGSRFTNTSQHPRSQKKKKKSDLNKQTCLFFVISLTTKTQENGILKVI